MGHARETETRDTNGIAYSGILMFNCKLTFTPHLISWTSMNDAPMKAAAADSSKLFPVHGWLGSIMAGAEEYLKDKEQKYNC